MLLLGLVGGTRGVAPVEKRQLPEQAPLGAAVAIEAAATTKPPERGLGRRTLRRRRLGAALVGTELGGSHDLPQRLPRRRRRRWCRRFRAVKGTGGEDAAIAEELVGGAGVGVIGEGRLAGEEAEVGVGVEEGPVVDGDAVARVGEVVGEGDSGALHRAPCRALCW